MKTKANVIQVFLYVLVLAFSAFSQLAYADWSVGVNIGGPGYYHNDYGNYGWHYWRYHNPQYGYHVHYLHPGYAVVWVGGARYFYYQGLYYSYVGDGDYVLVNPPVGAYVNWIPPDFQPVIINGRTFYTDNGVYYRLTPNGYKVVQPPVVYAQPQEVIEAQPVVAAPAPPAPPAMPMPADPQGSFTVNVPNSSGGYTSVVVTRSGNGYVGPQGEFYATFPTVAQLKAMYGK